MINLKKINNKFIIWVVTLIILIITIQIKLTDNIDRNSYVTLVTWIWYINDIKLDLDKREIVYPEDIIKTTWDNSLVIIEWWDWSITRLWWDSELQIRENLVSSNLSEIKISFELLKWKTWSNVISFMWENSYFKEYYADSEAAVRWTIFELNLDRDYIYVDKHEVKVVNSKWEEKTIPEKKPFNINTFSFIDLQKFIKDFQDIVWKDLNKKLDIEFFNKLKTKLLEINNIQKNLLSDSKNLLSSLENTTDPENINELLSNLDEVKKEKIYDDLLEEYQDFNFVWPDSIELYEKKLLLKKALIAVWSDRNKQNLIDISVYDLKDIIKLKQTVNLEETLDIFNSNKNFIQNIDFSFLDNLNIDFASDWVKKSLDFFKLINDDVNNKVNNLWEEAKNLLDNLIN